MSPAPSADGRRLISEGEWREATRIRGPGYYLANPKHRPRGRGAMS